MTIYVLLDHVIVTFAVPSTAPSALLPPNLLYILLMNHEGNCHETLSKASLPLSHAPLDVDTNIVVSAKSTSALYTSAPAGLTTFLFSQAPIVSLASRTPVVVSLTVTDTF